ncbi:hypothetical protein CIPAW_10G159300 [Carya illinoinensis]|uniref:Secreted protein n=1 Tax=Carya illinoinensis TaxID=32201 RepID=A0A8T1P6J7_CARIL|nr:hypothetical protein CIPAW_10G159300 [Carya illinoinensis]
MMFLISLLPLGKGFMADATRLTQMLYAYIPSIIFKKDQLYHLYTRFCFFLLNAGIRSWKETSMSTMEIRTNLPGER